MMLGGEVRVKRDEEPCATWKCLEPTPSYGFFTAGPGGAGRGAGPTFRESYTEKYRKRRHVMKTFCGTCAILFIGSAAFGAISTVHGTVTKVDSTAHTIVVRTAEGTEHTLHVVGK